MNKDKRKNLFVFLWIGIEREKEKDWRQSKEVKQTNKKENKLKWKANKKQSVGTDQHECFKALSKSWSTNLLNTNKNAWWTHPQA